MRLWNRVSLRIVGDLDLERISKQLAVVPSDANKKGTRLLGGAITDTDVWGLTCPYDNNELIEKHFEWIIEQFDGKYEILREIGSYAKIDIFCGITYPEQSGFSLSHNALSIFHDLKINLEVSLIGGWAENEEEE